MLQQPYCKYTQRLLDKLIALKKKAKEKIDLEEIKKAIWYAITYHGEKKRDSGEPFYSHPLEVAYMVSDYLFKTDVLVASILHDIVEDTEVTTEMILDHFGGRVAEMVDRLTRYRFDGSKLTIEQTLNNIYQFKDIEVLLIKLLDRLHNVKTLEYKSNDKIEKTLFETITQFIVPSIYYGYNNIEKELWKAYCYHENLNYDSLAFVDSQFNREPLSVLSLAYKNVKFPM